MSVCTGCLPDNSGYCLLKSFDCCLLKIHAGYQKENSVDLCQTDFSDYHRIDFSGCHSHIPIRMTKGDCYLSRIHDCCPSDSPDYYLSKILSGFQKRIHSGLYQTNFSDCPRINFSGCHSHIPTHTSKVDCCSSRILDCCLSKTHAHYQQKLPADCLLTICSGLYRISFVDYSSGFQIHPYDFLYRHSANPVSSRSLLSSYNQPGSIIIADKLRIEYRKRA